MQQISVLKGKNSNLAAIVSALALLVILPFLFTACPTEINSASPSGSISGHITVESGLPIGFLVSVAETSYMATTGIDGKFKISNVPVGKNYFIVIVKENYSGIYKDEIGNLKSITVSSNSTTVLDDIHITTKELATGSVTIGENGNWFINGVDTGIKVSAPDADTPFLWQGAGSSHPENPELNWAYYNTVDKTSFIWNGKVWKTLKSNGTDFCLVSFNENGGTPAPASPLGVLQGTEIPEPDAITKYGFSFAGWYRDEKFTIPAAFPLAINIDLTLYAKWEEIPGFTYYIVRFITSGGSYIADQRVVKNSTANRPEDPVRNLYFFAGWYSDSICISAYDFSEPVTGNTVIYAKWIGLALPIISIEEIDLYLAAQTGGTSIDDPVYLSINMSLSETNWRAILTKIGGKGKYVSLDLSLCNRSGDNFGNGLRSDGVFDPAYNSGNTGPGKIISLILPDAADHIRDSVLFSGFSVLRSIGGKKINEIYSSTFSGCTNIESVSFPAAASIARGNYYGNGGAFYSCTNLKNITLGVTQIDMDDLRYIGIDITKLQSVNFPEATSIGIGAFAECINLKNASFPKVVTIGENAFFFCENLISADFPAAANIDGWAFADCYNLKNISFPASVNIGECAFINCMNLSNFSVTGNGPLSVIENGKALVRTTGEVSELFLYPSASGDLTLNNITSIGEKAFVGCYDLKSVNFPETTSIGNFAFGGCENLKSVSFPEVTSIGEGAFNGCYNLKNILLGLKIINSDDLFIMGIETTNLENVIFPKLLVLSGLNLFEYTNLKSISFPATTSVTVNPFLECVNLSVISLIGDGPLSVIENEKALVRTIGEVVTLISYPSASGNITINSITSIGSAAFSRCNNLENVSFSAATNISAEAFFLCKNLESVYSPNVTSIGEVAFSECYNLMSVDFPKLTSIGEGAFNGCYSLESASFPKVTSIGEWAFSDCWSLSAITLPSNCSLEYAEIREDFSVYYESKSKAAGTYIFNDSLWTWTGP